MNDFISLEEFTPDIKHKGIKIGLFVEQSKKSEFEKEETLLILSIEVNKEKSLKLWDVKLSKDNQTIHL